MEATTPAVHSASETVIGVEIYRYCGETYMLVKGQDKLQNGNDVLWWAEKLLIVENLNSRLKKRAVSSDLSCYLSSLNIATSP